MDETRKIIIGYHGCDKSTFDKLIYNKGKLAKSTNEYDWLGNGVYFWENDSTRALEWAQNKVNSGKYKEAAVVGAVIDLGTCLNLHTRFGIQMLEMSYKQLERIIKMSNINNTLKDNGGFSLVRTLDCKVIENIHENLKNEKFSYDSVLGIFQEGKEIYPNAGFREKTHIQICVRNDKNILGYFIPAKTDE